MACHVCKQTPCAIAPQPTYECVIENVPVTVMKTKTKVDLVPVRTRTIMETKLETTYVDEKRTICWPAFETTYETRTYTVCRPVYETTLVDQPFTVCRPVSTTRQVTECVMKPFTEQVIVPVKTGCGLCGHPAGGCTCRTVARTCYRPVLVTRDVVETRMESTVEVRQVPVTTCRLVPETRFEKIPVTVRKMKTEDIYFKVPRVVSKSVPKTLVWKKAVVTCVEVPVTVYRPVMRMVPVVPCEGDEIIASPQSEALAPVESAPPPAAAAPPQPSEERAEPEGSKPKPKPTPSPAVPPPPTPARLVPGAAASHPAAPEFAPELGTPPEPAA
ncbi:hypothetical protein [Aquisphaera insulae]|uniref:hypothetical protein n=1 Tax=Aquisphaera insulae TaxID=2712864 RepID=UPI0013ED54E2|nr:hypothetical protein [Aquisphaera insulae]